MSRITDTYTRMVAAARSTGEDMKHDLGRGARIAVRVRDGLQVVTFSRSGAPVGDDELRTFMRHCSIPEGAERIPATGQKAINEGGRTRHLVAYRWPITAEMPL